MARDFGGVSPWLLGQNILVARVYMVEKLLDLIEGRKAE